MSREPSISGQRKLLKPDSTGSAYRKIIVTPCIVNSWLYCSGVSSGLVRPRELDAHDRGLEAAEQQEHERGDEVALADRLVVDRAERSRATPGASPTMRSRRGSMLASSAGRAITGTRSASWPARTAAMASSSVCEVGDDRAAGPGPTAPCVGMQRARLERLRVGDPSRRGCRACWAAGRRRSSAAHQMREVGAEDAARGAAAHGVAGAAVARRMPACASLQQRWTRGRRGSAAAARSAQAAVVLRRRRRRPTSPCGRAARRSIRRTGRDTCPACRPGATVTLVWPGITSILPASCGIQNEWMTSRLSSSSGPDGRPGCGSRWRVGRSAPGRRCGSAPPTTTAPP